MNDFSLNQIIYVYLMKPAQTTTVCIHATGNVERFKTATLNKCLLFIELFGRNEGHLEINKFGNKHLYQTFS